MKRISKIFIVIFFTIHVALLYETCFSDDNLTTDDGFVVTREDDGSITIEQKQNNVLVDSEEDVSTDSSGVGVNRINTNTILEDEENIPWWGWLLAILVYPFVRNVTKKQKKKK